MFKAYELKKTQGRVPSVSITKDGALVLNTGCVETFFNGYNYVKLFWDADNSKIGIQPMKKKDDLSYSLSQSPNKRVGWLSGTSFLRTFGIEHKKTKSYLVAWNAKEGLVEFSVPAKAAVRQ